MSRLTLLPAVGVMVISALYLWPMTGPGAWISGDSPFYLALTYALDDNLRAGRGLWGWAAHDLGGFPILSSFTPGPLGLLAMVTASRWAFLPMPLAYKAIVALAIALPAVVLAASLTRRIGPWGALVGGNLALLLTYHVVQPLNGGWAPYLAAGLLWGLVPIGERWLGTGPTWGRGAATILLASAAAASDGTAWVALPCVALALAVVHRRAGATRLVAWATLTLVPLALWIGLIVRVSGSGWGLGAATATPLTAVLRRMPGWLVLPTAGELVAKDLWPSIDAGQWQASALLLGRLVLERLPEAAVLSLAVVAGWRLWRQAPKMDGLLDRWSMVHALLAALLIGSMLIPRGPFAGWLVPPERLVPYVNLALVGLGATVLAGLRVPRSTVRVPRTALMVLAGLVLAHGARLATYGDHVLLKTAEQSVVYTEITDVWRFLRAQATGVPARALYETLEGVGFLDGRAPAQIAALASRESGVASLATWRVPSLSAVRWPALLAAEYPLRGGSLASLPEVMRRWNCQWVVVWWPGRREALRDSGAFEVVHESRNRLFTILKLVGYEPSALAFAEPARALPGSERSRPGVVEATVDNPSAGNRAVFKTTFHPGWRLRVNGEPMALVPAGGQIGTAPLPAGPITLTFAFGR